MFCPFFSVIATVLNAVGFILVYFIIANFYNKAKSENADDISYFIMLLLNFSLLVVEGLYTLWFDHTQTDACGPIP